MNTKFLDTHCHLDLFDNPEKIINQIKNNINIISMTTTPFAYSRNLQMFSKFENIKVALGLHPQLVNTKYFDFDLFCSHLKDSFYIGEIGLDKSKEYLDFYDMQKECFTNILKASHDYNKKVLSIHSRYAENEVLECINSFGNKKNIYILHWFTGSKTAVNKALSLNCLFSINGNMVDTAKGKDILKIVPLDKIILESDAPFGVQTLNEKYFEQLVNKIAQIKEINIEHAKEKISINNDSIWE